MAKTLFMIKGLPAAGKTTRAKMMLKEFGTGNAKRVNKDELRAMLDDSRFSRENEKFVLYVRDVIVGDALNYGKHVIVDDTNLAPKHEARLRSLARASEAAFEVIDMTDVSVDDCLERDKGRANAVGPAVILDMYDKYLAPPVPAAPEYDPALPDAIICDIDGTIAEHPQRSHYDYSRVVEDIPRQVVIDMLSNFLAFQKFGTKVLFVSGRDGSCMHDTMVWLRAHIPFRPWSLDMRAEGDKRKDVVIKREIYEREIKGNYNVLAIFDDRPQVIRGWQALGFSDRIFNVGPGKEF